MRLAELEWFSQTHIGVIVGMIPLEIPVTVMSALTLPSGSFFNAPKPSLHLSAIHSNNVLLNNKSEYHL